MFSIESMSLNRQYLANTKLHGKVTLIRLATKMTFKVKRSKVLDQLVQGMRWFVHYFIRHLSQSMREKYFFVVTTSFGSMQQVDEVWNGKVLHPTWKLEENKCVVAAPTGSPGLCNYLLPLKFQLLLNGLRWKLSGIQLRTDYFHFRPKEKDQPLLFVLGCRAAM